jgi:hypothetical protein
MTPFFTQHGSCIGAPQALKKENITVTEQLRSLNYDSATIRVQGAGRRTDMPRGSQPFEQDFILHTQAEKHVRQATQYTQLHAALVPVPDEDIWEWETSLDGEQVVDKLLDEDYATVWESILERL